MFINPSTFSQSRFEAPCSLGRIVVPSLPRHLALINEAPGPNNSSFCFLLLAVLSLFTMGGPSGTVPVVTSLFTGPVGAAGGYVWDRLFTGSGGFFSARDGRRTQCLPCACRFAPGLREFEERPHP